MLKLNWWLRKGIVMNKHKFEYKQVKCPLFDSVVNLTFTRSILPDGNADSGYQDSGNIIKRNCSGIKDHKCDRFRECELINSPK